MDEVVILDAGLALEARRRVDRPRPDRGDRGGDVRGREAVILRDGEPVARFLDQPWQGHDPSHWDRAASASAEGRVMLAGGLGPENVREAIAAVRPWAVDASSSLEREPGVKDHEKVRAWVAAARS